MIGITLVMQIAWASSRPPPGEMAAYDFASCDEARAAHAAPLLRHEPWYRAHLDRDDDGVACEFHLPTAARDLIRKLRE